MMSANQEQELKILINQRFDSLKVKFDELDKKVTDLNTEVKDLSTETKIIKVDLAWIKWGLRLFDGFIIVLSIIIFMLIGSST